jgi:hypothetical protein
MGRKTATIPHEEVSQKYMNHPLPCLDSVASLVCSCRKGEPASDPVATSADLLLRQENCESNFALQCLMLATDRDIYTIGDTFASYLLLNISYSTFQKGLFQKVCQYVPNGLYLLHSWEQKILSWVFSCSPEI